RPGVPQAVDREPAGRAGQGDPAGDHHVAGIRCVKKWVICASGPSMLGVDLALLRRHRSWRVIAVNNTWELVPWADVLYAGDLQWWERYEERVRGFAGERWTCDIFAAFRYRLNRVTVRDGEGLCRDPGFVHSGGNSGYQAVNLAWHFGARRIVLLGFDMHRNNGGHWHGEHVGMGRKNMLSAPPSHIAVWRRRFDAMARDLKEDGVKVVNATTGSALQCFQ